MNHIMHIHQFVRHINIHMYMYFIMAVIPKQFQS